MVQTSSKQGLRKVVDGATATAAFTDIALINDPPSIADNCFSTGEFSLARIVFGGSGSNGTINYRIVLWYSVGGQAAYVPMIVATGAATLSALKYDSDGILGPTGNRLADTITNTIVKTGTILHTPADDNLAWLEIDVRNAPFIQIETDLGTAQTADVFMQLGEASVGFTDIEVTGAGLATETTLGTIDTDTGSMATSLTAMALDTAELTSAPVAKVPVLLVKTATSGSQAALVASETFARAVYLQAKKVSGDNTANIFLGMAAVSVGNAEVFEVIPGGTFQLEMPAGTKVDLNLIFIDVDTTGDGVVGLYIPV